MSTQCDIQQDFSFRHDKELKMEFDGGRITSDAGLSVLRQFDHLIGFSRRIVGRLRDDRHPGYIIHSVFALVIQRLYALVAGYEDQNDADLLRHDGLFQLIADKAHLGDEMASQPTLSRFENAVSATENGALNDLLVETFVANIECLPWHASSISLKYPERARVRPRFPQGWLLCRRPGSFSSPSPPPAPRE